MLKKMSRKLLAAGAHVHSFSVLFLFRLSQKNFRRHSACMYVFVCVIWERERERESACLCMCVCVVRECVCVISDFTAESLFKKPPFPLSFFTLYPVALFHGHNFLHSKLNYLLALSLSLTLSLISFFCRFNLIVRQSLNVIGFYASNTRIFIINCLLIFSLTCTTTSFNEAPIFVFQSIDLSSQWMRNNISFACRD